MSYSAPFFAFQTAVRQLVRQAIEQGFEVPITVVSVSADGALTAIRCEWQDATQCDLDATIIADYASEDSDKMQLPLNIIVTDGRGALRRLLMQAGEPHLVH